MVSTPGSEYFFVLCANNFFQFFYAAQQNISSKFNIILYSKKTCLRLLIFLPIPAKLFFPQNSESKYLFINPPFFKVNGRSLSQDGIFVRAVPRHIYFYIFFLYLLVTSACHVFFFFFRCLRFASLTLTPYPIFRNYSAMLLMSYKIKTKFTNILKNDIIY